MRQEFGKLLDLYMEEVEPTNGLKADPVEVKKYMEKMKNSLRPGQKEYRNWEPILVVQTGGEQFEVVSNIAAYEAAKQLGVDKIWSVICDPVVADTWKEKPQKTTTESPKEKNKLSPVYEELLFAIEKCREKK